MKQKNNQMKKKNQKVKYYITQLNKLWIQKQGKDFTKTVSKNDLCF